MSNYCYSVEEEYLDRLNTRDSKALNLFLFCHCDIRVIQKMLRYKTKWDVMAGMATAFRQLEKEVEGEFSG